MFPAKSLGVPADPAEIESRAARIGHISLAILTDIEELIPGSLRRPWPLPGLIS
jgi:hypothetical protein